VKCSKGIRDAWRMDRPQLSDDIRTVAYRINGAEKAQAERVVGPHPKSLDEFAGVTSDVVAELAPEDAYKQRVDCVDGTSIVAGGSPLLRDGGEGPDCRFGGREVAFERFQVVGRNCLLEGRQPQLLRLSEQSCAISRVAELPRENSGFLEPEGAAPEIGRQPSASFQGCRGDCVRATELRAFGGRFEPPGHVFVRTSRGACSVPGGTIGIIGESLGEGSMRPPPLLGGCRLLDG